MTTDSPLIWDPPGPGSWVHDSTHQPEPCGRFFTAVFVPAYSAGFAAGMAAIGSPLETIQLAVVNGWLYTRPKPLGGPDRPGATPPPKFVFELLFRIHPELRRRLRTARTVFDDGSLDRMLTDWRTVAAPDLRRRLDTVAAVDPVALDDEALTAHVDATAALFAATTEIHFEHAPWSALMVGDFLVQCEGAGIGGTEAMQALTGFATPVRRPTELADEIVRALRAERGLGALDGPGGDLFDAVSAAGPRSASALRAYLDEVGTTLAGGGSLLHPTVAEQPAWVQKVLRSRVERGDQPGDGRAAAERTADELAARVPASRRADWRRSLADARAVAPLRDDDGSLLSEAIGLVRRSLLEVGRRLVDRGIASAPTDAVELRPDEVGPTLAGRGVAAGDLRRWVDERARNESTVPPKVLGPPPSPPPADRFPAPVARVARAAWAFISRFDSTGDERGVGGHGVSPGAVTGRAAIIRVLADLDRVEPGDIIVARATMPTFNTVLAMSAGVVTETGGAICHAAIMARELGIPGVVGYPDALAIPDGATIHLDGGAGTVQVLSDAAAD